MNTKFQKKIFAVEMALLLVISGSIGYIILSKPGLFMITHENPPYNDVIQDTIKTTDESPISLQAHIKAGPLTGYGPLTVYFYGNPENDPDIVSYHWEFGPTTMPIIPETQYKKIRFFMVLFLLFNVFYLLFYAIFSNYRYKASSQYESNEQNPTMIFPYTGSYSATLTVTDKEGNTSSDIVWITVLQYVFPDHD